MSRHLGLIIGVNHYQDSTFRPLQCAENDARALAQWLVNARGGNWSPPDVQLVQGQHATKELIESLITQICLTKAEAGDVILLYFAGHAFIDERSGEGYLALTNSRYQDTTTCLSLPSFAQHVLARSQASHILCIMDCFQTGQVWNMRRTSSFDAKPLLGQTVLNMLQAQPNRLLMTSCRGNDYAPEVGERGLGLLMHRTIIGLSGPIVEQPGGQIALTNLHAYLYNTLGEQQRPQLFGQQQTPFVLVGELATAPATGSSANLAPVGAPPTPMFNPSMGTGAQMQQATPFGTGPTPGMSPPSPPSAEGPTEQQKQALLNQAQQQFQAQNYNGAALLIEQILQADPQYKDALILKGQMLGTTGRYNEARASIERLLQLDPNNAMAWSMQAVVLSNQGHYQPALEAIERSLELEPQNPESYAIKNNIMGSMALAQSQAKGATVPKQFTEQLKAVSAGKGFARGLGLHVLGIVLGLAGFALLSVATLPYFVGLVVASIGLGLLIVNGTRGAFRYGASFLVLTILTAILILAVFFGTYKFGLNLLVKQLNTHPSIFQPLAFLCVWLAAAALLPFIGSLGGLISRAFKGGRKK